MRRFVLFFLFSSCAAAAFASGGSAGSAPQGDPSGAFWTRVEGVIQRYLGRPYVWGASGLKSFDCSGFAWRVMRENGILVKRTTARKFYMSLPKVSSTERWSSGNIVFFDDLKHCGIVQSPATFYHAELSKGTTVSRFDPFWRPKVCGFRRMPQPNP